MASIVNNIILIVSVESADLKARTSEAVGQYRIRHSNMFTLGTVGYSAITLGTTSLGFKWFVISIYIFIVTSVMT